MAKEEGAYKPLTQLPVLYLILRKGAGVDARVGRAYRVRDFFYKVFSRAFVKGVMGQRGLRMEGGGCRSVRASTQ